MDGVGDIGNPTPLEEANTPNLDEIASNSRVGLMYTIGKGIAPESDTAIFSILGNDIIENYTGRGPIEAFGAGIKFNENEVVFRANFASFEGNKLVDRRVKRMLTTEEAKELSKEINEKVKFDDKDSYFRFYPTIEHRGVLVIGNKKEKLYPNITNLDVGYKKIGNISTAVSGGKFSLTKALDEKSTKTSELVNEFFEKVRNVLSKSKINEKRIKKGLLPANGILVRGGGNKLPNVKNINEMTKRKWASIVGMPLETGITKLVGMKVFGFEYPKIKNFDIYSHLFDCLDIEIENAKEKLKEHWNEFDAFYVHFKETDIPGHDGLRDKKIRMIEEIDKEFFSFAKKLDANLIITADHCTPVSLKRHSDDPVPISIKDGSDGINKFGENYFRNGSINIDHGWKLMKFLLKMIG